MLVRFAVVCDKCGKRSEEYGSFPTCSECQEHVCPACDIPSKRTEDERDLTVCKACHDDLTSVAKCTDGTCGLCDECDSRAEQSRADYDIENRGK